MSGEQTVNSLPTQDERARDKDTMSFAEFANKYGIAAAQENIGKSYAINELIADTQNPNRKRDNKIKRLVLKLLRKGDSSSSTDSNPLALSEGDSHELLTNLQNSGHIVPDAPVQSQPNVPQGPTK